MPPANSKAVVTAMVTCWPSGLAAFRNGALLSHTDSSPFVLLVQEHRLGTQVDIQRARLELRALPINSVFTPALAGPKGGGGLEALLWLGPTPSLSRQTLARPHGPPRSQSVAPLGLRGWSASMGTPTLRRRGALAALGRSRRSWQRPTVIGGDFNLEPAQARAVLDARLPSAAILAHGDACYPSHGKPSCSDCFVATEKARTPVVSLSVLPTTLATPRAVSLVPTARHNLAHVTREGIEEARHADLGTALGLQRALQVGDLGFEFAILEVEHRELANGTGDKIGTRRGGNFRRSVAASAVPVVGPALLRGPERATAAAGGGRAKEAAPRADLLDFRPPSLLLGGALATGGCDIALGAAAAVLAAAWSKRFGRGHGFRGHGEGVSLLGLLSSAVGFWGSGARPTPCGAGGSEVVGGPAIVAPASACLALAMACAAASWAFSSLSLVC
jgi:hypothetical protein